LASSRFSGTVAGDQIRRIISLINLAPADATRFSGTVTEEEVEDFCEGSFLHTHPLLCLLFCFTLFILPASFLLKTQKN
jgi:hypothetical protein